MTAIFIKFKFKPTLTFGIILLIISLSFSIITYDSTAPAVATAQNDMIALPVVMYHGILKDKNLQGEYVISPKEFEEDMKNIHELGFNPVITKDIINYVYNKKPLPENPIIITFDDGYYNNYLYAYPILKKYGYKAVLSPVVYFTEEYSKSMDLNGAYANCTWDNLKEMIEADVFEIQNHSYNLHKPSGKRQGVKKRQGESPEKYEEIITEDIVTAQTKFKEKLNITPSAFVYPFGAKSDSTTDILKKIGFKATFICEEKINYLSYDKDCLYDMGRYLRSHNENSRDFFEKLYKNSHK